MDENVSSVWNFELLKLHTFFRKIWTFLITNLENEIIHESFNYSVNKFSNHKEPLIYFH